MTVLDLFYTLMDLFSDGSSRHDYHNLHSLFVESVVDAREGRRGAIRRGRSGSGAPSHVADWDRSAAEPRLCPQAIAVNGAGRFERDYNCLQTCKGRILENDCQGIDVTEWVTAAVLGALGRPGTAPTSGPSTRSDTNTS